MNSETCRFVLSNVVESEIAGEDGYDLFEPTLTLEIGGMNVFHVLGIEGAKTMIMNFREDAIRETLKLARDSHNQVDSCRYWLHGTGFSVEVEKNGNFVDVTLRVRPYGPTPGVSSPQDVKVGTVSLEEWTKAVVSVSQVLSDLVKRLNPKLHADQLFQRQERKLLQLAKLVDPRNSPRGGRPLSAGSTRYTCPCCGYKTLEEPPPGTYDICPICFWEDDPLQFDDPDLQGGANHPSLRQAQKNFLEFGAVERRLMIHVRKPRERDEKDPNWRPVE